MTTAPPPSGSGTWTQSSKSEQTSSYANPNLTTECCQCVHRQNLGNCQEVSPGLQAVRLRENSAEAAGDGQGAEQDEERIEQ